MKLLECISRAIINFLLI